MPLSFTTPHIKLMTTIHAFAIVLLLAFTASPASSQTAPVVSTVVGVQRAGTTLVDITYDLADSDSSVLNVTLQISSDAGATWTVPITSATGQVGAGISPGSGRAIVWNAGTDWNNLLSTTMRYRITADDTPAGMALIPAGSFTMGRTSFDGDTIASPVSVYVSSFYMAKYEVTKALWDEVRTWGLANGYTDIPAGGTIWKAADHPVQGISWYAVVKWCNARSQKEGLAPSYTLSSAIYQTGDSDAVVCDWSTSGYRLPTEAEWEKAARGGVSGQRFPWGDTITHSQANYSSDASYSYDVSLTRTYNPIYMIGGSPYTSPVGSFAANGYGLYGMAGNVFERCWDWYLDSYSTNELSDPRGPATGVSRVMRGGSWSTFAETCRAGSRYSRPPGESPPDGAKNIGFRPARSLVP
jgi:formylglycine-generating enzyme required for sulfatase activity